MNHIVQDNLKRERRPLRDNTQNKKWTMLTCKETFHFFFSNKKNGKKIKKKLLKNIFFLDEENCSLLINWILLNWNFIIDCSFKKFCAWLCTQIGYFSVSKF